MIALRILTLVLGLIFIGNVAMAEETTAPYTVNGTINRDVIKGDGSRSWEATKTVEDSLGHSATVDINGASQKVDENTRTWSRQAEGTTEKGKNWTTTTTGEINKTDTGKEWSTTTQNVGPNGGVRTVDKTGTTTRNEDGSVNFSVQKDITTKNGETKTITKEGTVTKTEDGVNVKSNTSGTGKDGTTWDRNRDVTTTRAEDGTINRTGTEDVSNSKGRSAHTDIQGTGTKNEEGGRDWKNDRTTTTDKGKTWTRTDTGSTARDGNGNRSWNKDVTRTGDVPKRNIEKKTGKGHGWGKKK